MKICLVGCGGEIHEDLIVSLTAQSSFHSHDLYTVG